MEPNNINPTSAQIKPTLDIQQVNPAEISQTDVSLNTTSSINEDETQDPKDDEETPSKGSSKKKRSGRKKIKIEFIQEKSRRHITFSKRKGGIMKKAYELSTLTGTQVLLLVASETGHVYTFATSKLQPLITKPEGKNLIQHCLNAPDPANTNPDGDMTHPLQQQMGHLKSEDQNFVQTKGEIDQSLTSQQQNSMLYKYSNQQIPPNYSQQNMSMYPNVQFNQRPQTQQNTSAYTQQQLQQMELGNHSLN